MSNRYRYGSDNPQPEMNKLYSDYVQILKRAGFDELSKKYKPNRKKIGSIVAEIFKSNIEKVLDDNRLSDKFKVSQNNVYIEGLSSEFDLLILKRKAKNLIVKSSDKEISYDIPIYEAEDVVAILECKTNGIYSNYKAGSGEFEKHSLYNFVKAYTALNNNEIKIGYMTLSEKSVMNGKSSLIENTFKFFEDYLGKEHKWYLYFAKCYFESKKAVDCYASDGDWEKFVLNLVGQRKKVR